MRRTGDSEVTALGRVVHTLDALSPAQRGRVLDFLRDRYGKQEISVPAPAPPSDRGWDLPHA